MATTRTALTDEDIRALIKGPTADERAIAAHKICRRIDGAELTDEERIRAHEILRLMACDAAELVRRALAVTLKASVNMPRDVALKLAQDIDSIALPVLAFSPAFTDDDLRDIVRLAEPVRQIAIARRPEISEAVTATIVEFASQKAVETACSNDNARFSELSLQKAVERFSKAESVLQAVAYRQILPLSVTEKLITLVSDTVREHLVSHHAVSPETALQITLGARERASVDLVDQAGRTADVRAFTVHLSRAGRLTPSLLLRALAHGHMGFVEHAIAELSSVPHHRAWLMVHDAGPLGLKAIYERAGLPARLYPAFRAGIDTYHSLEREGGLSDRERFQQSMLERFLTQPQPATREDMDYLIDKLDRVRTEVREREVGAA
jgi:uncharacterized protein (DUF2336 family)